MIRILTFSLFFLLLNIDSKAQDNLIGNWQLINVENQPSPSFNLNIIIGIPDKNIVYPATLHIESNGLHAEYQMMLAKKNNGRLYLHSKKITTNTVFQNSNHLPRFINGYFRQKKDSKGNLLLKLERLTDNEQLINISAIDTNCKLLEEFLQNNSIELKKLNNETLDKNTTDNILQPKYSKKYLGLHDTIFVKSTEFSIEFQKNKDNDVISVQLNGSNIVDEIDSKKRRDNARVSLDTGLNLLCFFAEDEGSTVPYSGASVKLKFDHFNKILSFKDTENIGANFIALRIYVEGKGNENDDEENPVLHEIDRKNYEDSVIKGKSFSSDPNNISMRESSISGDYTTYSPQLIFAIWDDAVEDGDSISLSVNDIWITRTFPVKKKPQFLTVNLKPGTNVITFAANNLGGIPPNTSVLEIIDGKKRKSFYIETDLNKNNLVRIFYDIK